MESVLNCDAIKRLHFSHNGRSLADENVENASVALVEACAYGEIVSERV